MASVWRAHDLLEERTVALKIMRPAAQWDGTGLCLEASARIRFAKEAYITRLVDHPAVVRVLDTAGLSDEPPYFVMEFVDGWRVSATRAIPPVGAVSAMLPIAGALCRVHELRIVHLDVKRHNLHFVGEAGPDAPMKLLDFGLASSALHGSPPTDGVSVGTPGYMSPEQIEGRRPDPRMDIWGFCVALYELVADQPAFLQEDLDAAIAATLRRVPPTLEELGAADRELSAIVARGMQRDLRRRWRTMNDVRRALARWLLARGVDRDPYGGCVRRCLEAGSGPSSSG